MSKGRARIIVLNDGQRKILEAICEDENIPESTKTHCKIVLLAESGISNNEIVRRMNISYQCVQLWRNRYADAEKRIKEIEEKRPDRLKSEILCLVSDIKRSGKPRKFTDDIVTMILALACEDPEMLGLPFKSWTTKTLKEEILKRGIIEDISTKQIGKILNML